MREVTRDFGGAADAAASTHTVVAFERRSRTAEMIVAGRLLVRIALRRSALLLSLAVLALGCQEESSQVADTDNSGDAPDLAHHTNFCRNPDVQGPIAHKICALFPDGDLEEGALYKLKQMNLFLRQGNLAQAREEMFDIVRMLVRFRPSLVDPNGAAPPTKSEAIRKLIIALFERVNLPVFVGDPEDFDLALKFGIVAVVGPNGGTFTAKNKQFNINFGPGTFDSEQLLVGFPLPNDSNPLNTPRSQYFAFYDLSLHPGGVNFDPPATIGQCVTAPEEQTIAIGHNLGGGPSSALALAGAPTFEVLFPPVPPPPGLNCSTPSGSPTAPSSSASTDGIAAGGAVSSGSSPAEGKGKGSSGARLADTTKRSVGGQASGFSEFGGVDASDLAAEGTSDLTGTVFQCDPSGTYCPEGSVGAFVQAFCAHSEGAASTFTGTDGTYTFENIPVEAFGEPNTCTIQASKEGFSTSSVEHTVTEDPDPNQVEDIFIDEVIT